MTQHIPAGSFNWDDAAVAELRRLVAAGLSYSRIATEMGLVSRGAAIGKAHRLGMLRGESPRVTAPRKPRVGKQTVTRRRIIKNQIMDVQEPEPMHQAIDVDDQAIPRGQRRTLLELTDATCKWPVGTPGHPDFFFCAAAAVADLPYCAAHARRAYQPTSHVRRAFVPRRGMVA